MRTTVPVRRGLKVRVCGASACNGRRFRRRLGALLFAATAAAVIAGCGASRSPQAASGSAPLLTTLESWNALQTPVDEAVGIVTQQCMAQHGYRYYPYPEADQPGGAAFFSSPLFGSSLWLGPQSLAWRIVNGWGLYEQIMEQLGQPGGLNGSQPQEFQVMRSLRGSALRRYMKTLYGGGKQKKIRIPGLPHLSVQIGGCNTKAGTRLFGSVAASVAVPQYGQAILNGSIQSRAASSPAVRASVAKWEACVDARTKIKARSPSQLFLRFWSLYHRKGPTPAVHRQELAAAVADLECQRRSRLPQTVQKAALAAVARLPASVVGELQTLVSALQQARTRAQAMFAHPITTPTVPAAPAASGSSATQGQGSSSAVVLGA